jgi:phosphate-selective porin OprO/OprP
VKQGLAAARILLIALAGAFAPRNAAAQAPPEQPAVVPSAPADEYGIFEPVTIDPPASDPPASPSLGAAPDAPTSEPARTVEPATEITTATVPATEPDEPKPTLANLDREREAALPNARYKIGNGVTLSSANGRYSLQVRARLQFRYDLDHPNFEDEATSHVFQIRRARVVLAGNVFSPHIRYQFQFGFSPRDMANDIPSDLEDSIRRNPLRDARLEFTRLRDFTIWAGQMKVPFSRERVISSSNLSMVDRSLVNAELSLDRDIGVAAISKDIGGLGKLAYYAGVFLGEGRNSFESQDTGLLYVGRFEVNPFGQFEDYVEGDGERSEKPGLSLGAAYAFHDRAHAARGVGGNPPADGGTTNFHHFTADVVFKWWGVSLLTSFHLRRGFDRVNGGALDADDMPIPTAPARQGIGWLGQLGWVVPKIPLEFVGRYGLSRNIYGDQSTQPDADEVGAGINWYFVGHNLKLQLDYFRLWDGSLAASYGEQARLGTDRIRVQVQLYF